VPQHFTRLVGLVERRFGDTASSEGTPFALRAADGAAHVFGRGAPAFTVVVNDARGVAALSTLDRSAVIEAYLDGSLDLQGDIMHVVAMRELFPDRHPVRYLWRFVRPLLFGQVRNDTRTVTPHYDLDADFFRLFLDRRHRCYSQAVFAREDEPLEDAITRKLDIALDAVGARPGDRVLDIGSGWGALVEHAGRKDVRVTSLTISAASEAFVQALIDRERLPCRVLREHFLEHASAEPYDAIVNLGVTEHLPDYRATLRQYEALLKPGGRVYLDASAQRVKNAHSTFMERHVYQGNGSLLCLHEYLAEVARSPFDLVGVWDDRRNYHLTTKAWAERLDAAREEFERRWGQRLYRTFQLYLWGSAEGFLTGMIDAYRVVLRLP
jgi:cyclopropane-fatty-acyl-phospholipid synthase